jgi:hypothetical protein
MPIAINDCVKCGKTPEIDNRSVDIDYDFSISTIEIYCASIGCYKVIEDDEVLVAIKKWNEANGGNNEQTDKQI